MGAQFKRECMGLPPPGPLLTVIAPPCTPLQLKPAACRSAAARWMSSSSSSSTSAPRRHGQRGPAGPRPCGATDLGERGCPPAARSVALAAPQRPRGRAPGRPRNCGRLPQAAPPPQRAHTPPPGAAAPPPPPTDLLAPPRPSQVQCDACEKWRRVPADLAQNLSDDEPWWVLRQRAGWRRCPPLPKPLVCPLTVGRRAGPAGSAPTTLTPPTTPARRPRS